jgi:release factor glutamine methyltransferase
LSQDISELIAEAAALLQRSGVPDARKDAGLLLGHVLERDRAYLISHPEKAVTPEALNKFMMMVERRAQGEPLQYITGHQEFFGLDFEVSPAALIPRPETELLVETALALMKNRPQPQFCDVGTGTGCIAITLLHHLPSAQGLALDISPDALELAKRNAAKHGVLDRLDFRLSDCLEALTETEEFDLLASNPPYVAEEAMAGLQREVRDFEPSVALTPGGDGLAIIRNLISAAPRRLKIGGYLLLEIGFDQRDRVLDLVDPEVWSVLDVHKDLQGIPRTVVLEKL